jgi:putative ABC transport system permease protein
MDIAAAQWAFGRLGYVDRDDERLKEGLETEAARRQIAARLPAGLRVELSEQASARNETMIAAFHFNLAALSGIALLVGLFLIYNTASIGVAARREELGILQAVGAGRPKVLALVLGETMLVWAAGFALGLLMAERLARGAVGATARTVETFYLAEAAEASARQLSLTPLEVALAAAITLPLALAAALWPAWRAATVPPVEVIHGAPQMRHNLRPPRRLLAAATVFAAVGGGLAMLPPVRGLPVFGFAAGAVLVLAGAFLVPAVLWAACRLVRRAAVALPPLRAELRLASANLLGSIGRVSTSVAALAVSLAMALAIAVLVGSFRETVIYWLDSTLRADVLVRPITLNSATSEAEIPLETLAAFRRDPDVASVNWVQIRQIPYGDRGIRLAAAPLDLILRHETLLFKSPHKAQEAVRRAIDRDELLVSESFSIRFGKRPGDEVQLPTPAGQQAFRVAAVYYDYASNQGTVTVDSGTYRRRFAALGEAPSPSSMGLYLRTGADAETVRARLARTVPGAETLAIVTQDNVRREALKVFDSTFRITYALQAIAIVIAGLGIFSTLLTLVYERRQEIGLISLVGAAPRQVRRMVVFEAMLLGAVSQAVGLLIGLSLAVILIYVVNVQSFGWTIQFHWPPGFVLQSTVLILAAAALFGLYPAVRAANIEALQTVRDE